MTEEQRVLNVAKRELAFWYLREGRELLNEPLRSYGYTHRGKGHTNFVIGPAVYANRMAKLEKLFNGAILVPLIYRKTRFLIADVPYEIAWEIRKVIDEYAKYERRKQRMNAAEGFHHPEHIRKLWEIQQGKCYYSGVRLGTSFEKRAFHVDHLVPLATALHPKGTNWPTNLVLVSSLVNASKGNRRTHAFLAEIRITKTFKPMPASYRHNLDRLREDAFRTFMEKHAGIRSIEE